MIRAGVTAALVLALTAGTARAQTPEPAVSGSPVVIGTSYALPSDIYGAPREINVWLPPGYDRGQATYPVVYLLDGGQAQDFHHISGLAQLGTVNGTTRDVIVVGVASVDRRNELALPTEDAELIARYPTQGRSTRFRDFLAREVMPFVETRFRTSGPSVLMGESLGGLFVVETFLKEPQMFDAYVAVSPSLWWDGGRLARQSGAHLRDHSAAPRTLMLFLGDEGPQMQDPMDVLVGQLRDYAFDTLTWSFEPRPDESHATIYHDAALDAFRALFAYPPEPLQTEADAP